MKLLVAGRGTHPDDWTWTVDGELVYVADVHEDLGEHCNCGCTVAFIGFASSRATTTAVVADLDITADELVQLVTDWWGGDPDTEREQILEVTADLLDAADPYPVGTRVRRFCDEVEEVR